MAIRGGSHTVTTQKGFLSNLLSSVLGIPIGILLFLASFVIIYKIEGRTNWSKVAEQAVVADANTPAENGFFVSVTGPLTTEQRLGDPEYLQDGEYISLSRSPEMYAWIEESRSETRDKVGGGTETITTYSYRMDWTSSPRTSGFNDPSYSNPPMPVESASFRVDTANIGAWTFAPADTARGNGISGGGMPGGSTLTPTPEILRPGVRGQTQGEFLYLGTATPTAANHGDVRIRFSALRPGGQVTGFGKADNGRLTPYDDGEGNIMMRVFEGTREAAISRLQTEYSASGWIGRIAGFMCMWIGMGMILRPLQMMAGIIPFIKKGVGFVISVITFFIALILTVIASVISQILHSWVAILVTFLLFVGFVVTLLVLAKKRKANAPPSNEAVSGYAPQQGPPPGFPPQGPPQGPPPGFPPQGPPPGFPPQGPPQGPPPGFPPQGPPQG